jgi:hypothetical protein
MANSGLDLATIFQAVTEKLGESKQALNEADSYNHNHGDNMVGIFRTITEAVGKKKGANAGQALAYASRMLKKQQKSGSAQVYAQGLKQAAKRFKSKQLTKENALDLVQALLGGGARAPRRAAPKSGDALASILGSLTGSQSGEDSGLDMGDLLSAGMALLQAKQTSGGAADSLIEQLVSGGKLGSSSHRSTSGKLVGSTLMKVLGALAG